MLPPDKIAENVLHLLQTDPRNYRNFGVYWWLIKGLLKRYYTTDNLYFLGGYIEHETAGLMPHYDGLAEAVADALAEYQANAAHNMMRAEVIAPNGEAVTIYDNDAGI